MFEYTWLGTASVRLRSEKTTVVFDPFFSRNPDYETLRMDDLQDVQAILLTHGHFDHASDVPSLVRQLRVPVYAAPDTAALLHKRHGLPSALVKSIRFMEPFTIGDFSFLPHPTRHIRYDRALVQQTIQETFWGSGRAHLAHLPSHLNSHLRFPCGTCIAWRVDHLQTSLLHLGSLAFDAVQRYPKGLDWLSLPYQGHSRLDELSLEALFGLKPTRVVLHHHDNTFPPISQTVDTEPFAQRLNQSHLPTTLYRPSPREPLSLV